MPQVSKYPIPQEVYNRIFEVFLKTVARLTTRAQVWNFFKEFLSPTEQIMLAKRLSIAFLLAKEYDYREISKILKVSTATIASVAISVKRGSAYKKTVDQLLKDEQLVEWWKGALEEVAGTFAFGSKGGAWISLKQELKEKRLRKPF